MKAKRRPLKLNASAERSAPDCRRTFKALQAGVPASLVGSNENPFPFFFVAGDGEDIIIGRQMKVITQADFMPFDWDAVMVSRRRRLPHVTMPGAVYFVTFRLGDAVPLEVARQWKEARALWLEQNAHPWTEAVEKEYHRRFAMRMERYLDAGHGACVLRKDAVRHEVIASLHHDDGKSYELGDLVVMPNHVHVLLKPLSSEPVSKLLGPVKGASSRRINQLVGCSGTLWMDESFDHIVRSLDSLKKFQRYVADNPVKAGLSADQFTYEQRWEIQDK